MVWTSPKLSFDRKLSLSRNKGKKKSFNKETVHSEPLPTDESSNWPTIVLKDKRKDKTLDQDNQDEEGPIREPTNNKWSTEASTAWPSSVLSDDKKNRKRHQQHQHTEDPGDTTKVNHESPQSDLWPSLIVDDKIKKGNDSAGEGRHEYSTSRMEEHDERDGVSVEMRHSRGLEPSGHMRSPSHDHLSNISSSSSEDDDDTGSYASSTYDTKSYGNSTLKTRSFDTRILDVGCFADERKKKVSPFNPANSLRDTESNNIVAALVHLTTKCYAPTEADMPY